MKFRGIAGAAAALAAAASFTGNVASAAPVKIFEDTFNRAANTSVGNGWIEDESSSGEAITIQFVSGVGFLSLRNIQSQAPDAAVLNGAFDTSGYTNVAVSFDYRRAPGGNEAGDQLYFAWGTTAAASNVVPTAGFFSNSDNYTSTNMIDLGPLAAATSIYLKLFTDVNATSEGYRIKNFVLWGEKVVETDPEEAPSGVPLPAALPLMVAGLGMIGLASRRRKRKAVA